MRRFSLFLFGIYLLAATVSFADSGTCISVYVEKFHNLDNWQSFNLPGVDETASFSPNEGAVEIRSSEAASGLLWSELLDIGRIRSMSWRVRVQDMPQNIDLSDRDTDDSPLRLMVVFSDNRDALTRMAPDEDGDLSIMGLIKGSGDCDILAYTAIPEKTGSSGQPMDSTVSSDIMLMPWKARSTTEQCWQEFSANPGMDYERAFGKPCPRWARLAIVVDTDDTGGYAMLWVDEIIFCGK